MMTKDMHLLIPKNPILWTAELDMFFIDIVAEGLLDPNLNTCIATGNEVMGFSAAVLPG